MPAKQSANQSVFPVELIPILVRKKNENEKNLLKKMCINN